MIQGIHHLAVQVRDVELVAAFYRRVLELQERNRFLREDGSLRSIWMSLSQSGGTAFLAIEAGAAEHHQANVMGYSMLALQIAPEERKRWLSRVQGEGLAIEKETKWTFYFRDPEQNLVGISHYPFDPL